MLINTTSISGVFVVTPEPVTDDRGFFARTVCAEEFARHGLTTAFVQQSISFNHHRGTLRGMHYQAEPHGEEKLVRVTCGALYDVVLDLREDSATFKKWYAVELSAANRQALYIPKGVAHGFQTLADNTEILYQISTAYSPAAARGVRWDDPAFAIDWPLEVAVISPKDRGYPDVIGINL